MVKRTRQSSPKGLASGQILHRDTLAGNHTSPWGWVGAEVNEFSSITRDHLLATCGLSPRNNHPFCRDKFRAKSRSATSSRQSPATTIDGDDVIVISDEEDERATCSKKACKSNPNCMNHLGQDQWEDEDVALDNFLKYAKLGENPLLSAKDPDLPVGLKNLGATCYANASLQVWFRDPAFRAGVYECQPLQGQESKFLDSPLFQLQVTFAALQESIQSVYNPTKLVESLQLRASEQQDAQEFSKLFMTHLDAEFKSQPNPHLRSLINTQFEGEQVYGTECENCHYRSERSSNFLEIEVNFQNNSKLEDCIESLLEPEELTGDNKYLCAQCESLQDATRYTELRKLPPVLHFSLLRFVYDLKTMERKKSKNAIVFPKVLYMDQFLGSSSQRQAPRTAESEINVYELRGILLHKGSSAYHGHYEAQVFDTCTDSWYQFNDELVTRIDKLGDKRSKKRDVDLGDASNVDELEEKQVVFSSPPGSKRKKTNNGSRKRQRIEDSDDELALTDKPPTSAPKPSLTGNSSDIHSKDAYMLIYSLRPPDTKVSVQNKVSPPPRALDVVNELNALHDKECESYAEKEKMARSKFQSRRAQVLDIYRSWSVASADEDCVIVSRDVLEQWLSVHSMGGLLKSNGEKSSEPTQISVNEILCEHGRLDHRKAGQMKRVSREAYEKIREKTNCVFEPTLSLDDVCQPCVKDAFTERLYQIEHPRIVNQFNSLNSGNEGSGYWISRAWLRDWTLQKPKMHVASESDPPPDSPDFASHVYCKHGGLSFDTGVRRRISPEAYQVLASLFPEWSPKSTDEEPCSICEVTISENKAHDTKHRKRADDEKGKLKHMHDYVTDGDPLFLDNVPCALIPVEFLRRWRQWIKKPSEADRPDQLDNGLFLCPHNMLTVDPNCAADLDYTAAIIKEAEWKVLESLYSAHPLISLTPSSDSESRYRINFPVCSECRHRRLSDWKTIDLTVHVYGKGSSKRRSELPKPSTYGKSGTRQSKRLREQGEKRRLTVTKSMTVKDVKVALSEELGIATICQRLLFKGEELLDNEATLEKLQILANDSLELREETGALELSDSEDISGQRDEGRGFGGTLLGTVATVSEPPQRSCGACTYANLPDALVCDMCATKLV